MKNLLSVGILAGFAMLFAQITAQAATYAFSFVGIDDPNILGSGDLFTSGSSPYAVTGATGSITDRYIPGGSFAITGLSLYAGADNLLYLPASTGFWDNSFGGISFATATGGDFNLGGGGTYAPEYNVLNASISNPVGYPVPQLGSYNIDLSVAAVPELSTWAMLGLGFAGLAYAAHSRSKRNRLAHTAA